MISFKVRNTKKFFRDCVCIVLIVSLLFGLFPLCPVKAQAATEQPSQQQLEQAGSEIKQSLENIDPNKTVLQQVSFGNKTCDLVGYFPNENEASTDSNNKDKNNKDKRYRMYSFENFKNADGSTAQGITKGESKNQKFSLKTICDNLLSSEFGVYDVALLAGGISLGVAACFGGSALARPSYIVLEQVPIEQIIETKYGSITLESIKDRLAGDVVEWIPAGSELERFFTSTPAGEGYMDPWEYTAENWPLKPGYTVDGKNKINLTKYSTNEGLSTDALVRNVTTRDISLGTRIKNFCGKALEVLGIVMIAASAGYEAYKLIKAAFAKPEQEFFITSIGCNDKGPFVNSSCEKFIEDGAKVVFNVSGKSGNYSFENTCANGFYNHSNNFKDVGDVVFSIDIIPGNSKFYDDAQVKKKIKNSDSPIMTSLYENGKTVLKGLGNMLVNPFWDGEFRNEISYSKYTDYVAQDMVDYYNKSIKPQKNIYDYTINTIALDTIYNTFPKSIQNKVDAKCDFKNWKDIAISKLNTEIDSVATQKKDGITYLEKSPENINRFMSIYNAVSSIPDDVAVELENNLAFTQLEAKYQPLKSDFENHIKNLLAKCSELKDVSSVYDLNFDKATIEDMVNFFDIYRNLAEYSVIKIKYADQYNQAKQEALNNMNQIIDNTDVEKIYIYDLENFNKARYLYCMLLLLNEKYNEWDRYNEWDKHTRLEKLKKIEEKIYGSIVEQIEKCGDEIESVNDCNYVLYLRDCYNQLQNFRGEYAGWNKFDKSHAMWTKSVFIISLSRTSDDYFYNNWNNENAAVRNLTGNWYVDNRCKEIDNTELNSRDKFNDWKAINKLDKLLKDSAQFLKDFYVHGYNFCEHDGYDNDEARQSVETINRLKEGFNYSDQAIYYDVLCYPVITKKENEEQYTLKKCCENGSFFFTSSYFNEEDLKDIASWEARIE